MKTLFVLLVLIGFAAGEVIVETGVLFRTDLGGNYTVTRSNINASVIVLDSSGLNITPTTSNVDYWVPSTGQLSLGGVDALLNTSSNLVLYGVNFADITANLSIVNVTGNFTNLTVCYTTTAQSNATFYLDNISGECPFTYEGYTGWGHTFDSMDTNRSSTPLSSCDVHLIGNASTGTFCVNIRDDPGMLASNLASIIGATSVLIAGTVYVLRRRQLI